MGEVAVRWSEYERTAGTPPAKMKISEWAATRRVLGANSAIKGLFQLSMVPFFVPIMDMCQSRDVDEIVVCKPAQIGGTTTMLNVIGYYSDQDPSPVMVILSDQNTAEYVSSKQIRPMFKESPKLRRLYIPTDFKKNEINLPNGGYIAITWASSVAELGTK